MDKIEAIYEAIRTGLIAAGAGITAIMPATSIVRANQRAKASYPCITIGVSGAKGQDYDSAKSGEINIYVYTTNISQPSSYCNNLMFLIFDVLDEKCLELSTNNIRFDTLYESFRSDLIAEEEVPNLSFMTTRYVFTAHNDA